MCTSVWKYPAAVVDDWRCFSTSAIALDSSFRDFVEPWLEREPLLAISARFAQVPDAWLARMVLIEELWQCQFGLSQLSIAFNKLNWWMEEAQRCVQGAPTHPLTKAADARPQAMLLMCESALNWLDQPHANDATELQQLWSSFAHAASDWVADGDSRAIWRALALKRQLQYHAKADRYGPSFCDRARLAEYQLRLSELSDRNKASALLRKLLSDAAQALTVTASARGSRSAVRAYASFHAEQAGVWRELPSNIEFHSHRPSIAATVRAWWRAREH